MIPITLSADTGNQISVGILAEKDGEIRLAVAFHRRTDEYMLRCLASLEIQITFSQIGQYMVGYVAERIGGTDIGLGKLDDGIALSNRFPDIDTSAKTLLLIEDIS